MQQICKKYGRWLLLVVLNLCAINAWAFELEATTQWHQRVELTPFSSGIVEKVVVQPGDQVKQGGLLLQLNTALEEAQLQLAQQRLKQAELLFAEAEREHTRVEDLYERTLISDHDRAVGEATWVGSAADLGAARMALISAKRERQLRELRAPFDAVVVGRQVEVGTITNQQLVQRPLITIASSTAMLVEGYVNTIQLAQVEGKSSLQVEVAGKKINAKVESVAMEPTGGMQGQYQIRLLIPYSKGLKSGMKALITVQ
jgi:RND family efflux transporter MFP subunit